MLGIHQVRSQDSKPQENLKGAQGSRYKEGTIGRHKYGRTWGFCAKKKKKKASNGLSSAEQGASRGQKSFFPVLDVQLCGSLGRKSTHLPAQAAVCETFTGVGDQNDCECESYYCSKNTLYQG